MTDFPEPRASRRSVPLPSPQALRERLPLTRAQAARIAQQRAQIRAILRGQDPRLLVVVGPCSLHERDSALEYAERLAKLATETEGELLLVMRAYIEKPRTTLGWKGLLYDPHLDGSGDMVEGLLRSRRLLLDIVDLGLPLASELLQPLATGYFDDLLGWAAIGARTSESQIHRELASGLDFPVGFKNGTDGSLQIACEAMHAAAHPHSHLGLNEQGQPALLQTSGNPDCHLVLRGGKAGSNYQPQHIAAARTALQAQGLPPCIMVDCSHANSGKQPQRQAEVLHSVLAQRLAGEDSLRALMLESHLFHGNQPLCAAGETLRYGVSVTDACLGWEDSEHLLRTAAQMLAAG